MNCKPGDMAIIVRSRAHPEHLGKVIQVHDHYGHEIGWTHTPSLQLKNGNPSLFICDSCLKPLRNDEGPDMMTLLAGIPSKEKA